MALCLPTKALALAPTFSAPVLTGVTLSNSGLLPEYTFTGQVNPGGLTTTLLFQVGTSTTYTVNMTQDIAAGIDPVPFSFTVPFSVNQATLMHGMVTAINSFGTTNSGDMTVSSPYFELRMSPALGNAVLLAQYADNARWLDANDDGYLDLAIQGGSNDNGLHAGGTIIFNPMLNLNYPPYNGPGNNQWMAAWSASRGPGRDGVILPGDFNNDNIPDVFWAASFETASQLLPAVSPTIAYGRHGSSATTLVGILTTLSLPAAASYPNCPRAAVADFDHSGTQQILLNSGKNLFNNTAGADLLFRKSGSQAQSGIPGGITVFQGFNTLEFVDNMLPQSAAGSLNRSGTTIAGGFLSNNGFMDLYVYNCPESTGFDFGQAGIYRNGQDGSFAQVASWSGPGDATDSATLYGGANAVWADFNGDGFDDLRAGENSLNTSRLRILLNDGKGNLTDSNWVLPQNYFKASFAVGDLFNHGRNDIVLTGGYGTSEYAPLVLRNDGNGTFTPITFGFHPVVSPTGHGVALADYDLDGRLDIAIAGAHFGLGFQKSDNSPAVYRNLLNIPTNSAPAAPTNLASSVSQGRVDLRWGNASDDITPTASLTYNLRIGTTPNGTDICSPLADTTTGWRKVAERGNLGHCLGTYYNLPPGTYYWSVQAIDGAYAGGAWAPEQSFTITEAASVTLTINRSGTGLTLNWPSRHVGYSVEGSTNFTTIGSWFPSTTPIGTRNGLWDVPVNVDTTRTFFRLTK